MGPNPTGAATTKAPTSQLFRGSRGLRRSHARQPGNFPTAHALCLAHQGCYVLNDGMVQRLAGYRGARTWDHREDRAGALRHAPSDEECAPETLAAPIVTVRPAPAPALRERAHPETLGTIRERSNADVSEAMQAISNAGAALARRPAGSPRVAGWSALSLAERRSYVRRRRLCPAICRAYKRSDMRVLACSSPTAEEDSSANAGAERRETTSSSSITDSAA